MGTQNLQEIHQLKNLINFSVDEFAVNKPSLEALWLNKGQADRISMLLNTEHGIVAGAPIKTQDFNQYDLIDALKQFIRNSEIFKAHNPHIENFIDTIQIIEDTETPNTPERFQQAMETLLLDLAKNEDIEKAYCIFQVLYLIRHIFRPTIKDDFFKCALVIGPLFQEAFGKQENATLSPVFYHAFAHIISNPKYDQTYHLIFSQVTSVPESSEQPTKPITDMSESSEQPTKPITAMSESSEQTAMPKSRKQSKPVISVPKSRKQSTKPVIAVPKSRKQSTKPASDSSLTKSQKGASKMSEQPEEFTRKSFTNSELGATKMSKQRTAAPKPKSTNKPASRPTEMKKEAGAKTPENQAHHKGFQIKQEHIDKAKDITVKSSRWLWHYSKILASNAWKATQFTYQHSKIAYKNFLNSAFYANMKEKTFKNKEKLKENFFKNKEKLKEKISKNKEKK